MKKNYLEFGSYIKKKKHKYELKTGNLYDWYMLPRYFNDIYLLNKYKKTRNIKKLSNLIHHKEDLKFNLINFILLKVSKSKSFYEYGQTLFEKYFFVSFFSNFLNIKFKDNIKWYGNDISQLFNFFCDNFYKKSHVKTYKKFNIKKISGSVFFSKGVTILYIKNNIKLLSKIINKSRCGSFDISLTKKGMHIYLNTGKKIHFPKIKEFIKIMDQSNKKIIVKKIKKNEKGKIYLEIVYGNKKIIKNFFNLYEKICKKFKNNTSVLNILDLKTKFYNYNNFKYKILKYI